MCKLRLMIIEATAYSYLMLLEDIHREICRYRAINAVPSSSSPIQDLKVKLVKIYDTNNVKLNGICYIKPTILLFLFELEQCVEHVFYELSQYTHDVSKKFEYFVSFLKQNLLLIKAILQTLCTKFMIKVLL